MVRMASTVLEELTDGAYGQHGAGRVNRHLHKFIFIITYFVVCICLVSFLDTFFFKFLVSGLEHFHSIYQKQELAKRGLTVEPL
jgi:hypothetical protein